MSGSHLSRIDVAFGFDSNYAPHVAAVIASIAARTASVSDIRFLLLHTGIPVERRASVEAAAPGARFHWIEVRASDLPQVTGKEAISHINETTFLRLATEQLAPADCEKLIYLDADIIVRRDLRDLWETDLGGAVLAAAPDSVDTEAFTTRWGLQPNPLGYFNAGVLVIDLKKVREEKLFSRARDFILANNPPLADQDALNWAAWGRWKPVDITWNVQRYVAIPHQAAGAPRLRSPNGRALGIVHYTGTDKPWLRSAYHPWAWLYWDALRRTSFFNEVAAKSGIGLTDRLRLRLRWVKSNMR